MPPEAEAATSQRTQLTQTQSPPATDKGRRRRLTPESAVIIAALLAIVGGYWGARVGADASIDVARMSAQSSREINEGQLAAERDRESREKRGEVYRNYLDNANSFYQASLELYEVQTTARTLKKPVSPKVINDWMNARYDFQGSVNDVFVYGSDEAWNLQRAVAVALPVSSSAFTTIPQVAKEDVEASKMHFNQSYREFQAQFSKEVPARPRTCQVG